MSTDPTTYQAYLLRFSRQDPSYPWRVTVQSTDNQQKFNFGSLEDAVRFLEERLEEVDN